MKKVVVASLNPVKQAAVEDAFQAVFAGSRFEVVGLDVESGVSAQPGCDEETCQGAHNRVRAAQVQAPGADYWVGLEGGLEWQGDTALASAWMVVLERDGRLSTARTPTLPLPPRVCALLRQGLELGEANDRVFATHNSKQSGGAFGLLTDGRMTRRSVYAQTLELALLPLVHPLWTAKEHTD